MKNFKVFLAITLLTVCFLSCGRRVCCSPPPHSLALVPSRYTFTSIGEQTMLSIVTTPTDYQLTNVIWTSSDKDVVTVDNGLVTAVGYGEATVTASTDGISVTCQVIVLSDPEILDN